MEFESLMKVVWSEGMPLWPQHLQQLDRYHERYVTQRLRVTAPWDWGIVQCEFDVDALNSGLIGVKRFTGVFPDGFLVSFGSDDANCPSARPIEEVYRPEMAAMDVYIAIAREREGVTNYAHAESAQTQNTIPSRFRVVSRTLPDLVGGGEPAHVEFARPNVVLRLGNESRDDFECLKVAEITRDADGRYNLSPSFIPACLQVGASNYMSDQLGRLHGALIERDRLLLASSEPWQKGVGGADTATLLRLALNAYIPWLDHVCEVQDLHPHAVYLELLKLAGQLAMFRGEDKPKYPRYEHVNLRATFGQMFAMLLDLLQITMRTQRYSVDLVSTGGGVYSGSLNEQLAHCERFFLAVASNLSDPEVGERLPLLAKAACRADLQSLLTAATPGLRLRWAPNPPNELSIRSGEACFDIDTTGPYWARILQAGDMAVYLTQPFEPTHTRLRLVGLPRSGANRSGEHR